ncbi:uncharacterized protein DS421_14g453420 [Arachis hypogaea]|nr:uncharacterized protein DS421_14g453420 [Arachis hypogaea]
MEKLRHIDIKKIKYACIYMRVCGFCLISNYFARHWKLAGVLVMLQALRIEIRTETDTGTPIPLVLTALQRQAVA